LRSLLLTCALRNAFACRVSMQIAGTPASANPLNSHCDRGPASGKGAGSGGSERPEPQLRKALFERGPPLDPAGAIAERLAAPGVLRHPLRGRYRHNGSPLMKPIGRSAINATSSKQSHSSSPMPRWGDHQRPNLNGRSRKRHRLRQPASHWRGSRSPHASCPYSGAERRELPAQAIEGRAAVCDPTRRRGRLGDRSQNRRNHHRFLKPRPPRLRNPGHLRRGGRGTSNSTPSRKLAWFCSGPLAGF
jgi:hypothetical protein